MINKNRLIKLTQRLIRARSENPPGDERRVAKIVKDELLSLGLKVKIYEFLRNRPNVVCVIPAKDNPKNKSLLISPHLDTVPAGGNWKFDPFGAKIYKGRIYGRGASDCKGNLAASLEAMRSIVEEEISLDYDLIFVASADEETGSQCGITSLLNKKIIRPTLAVILDGDNFNIITSQKGLIHFKVSISGKKAHGAYPWKGINAIDIAVELINKLKRLRFVFKAHPLLHPPTINIGTIRGGDKVNIVSDWCEFEVDLRFLPGMKPDKILSSIKTIFKNTTQRFKIKIQSLQQPYEIDKNHKLISSLCEAIKEEGIRPKLKGSEGATVMTFFSKICPALAFGFATSGRSHITDEYVLIDDLYKGAVILERFIKNY